MQVLKTVWYFSILTTFLSGIGIVASLGSGEFITVLYLLPVLALSYPITLFGASAYLVKKVLQEKSVLELLSMAGGGQGLGMFTQTGEEDNEKQDKDSQQK